MFVHVVGVSVSVCVCVRGSRIDLVCTRMYPPIGMRTRVGIAWICTFIFLCVSLCVFVFVCLYQPFTPLTLSLCMAPGNGGAGE